MSRGLNAATLAVLGNQELEMFHLYTFYFGTTFRLTDHAHDINYDFGAGTETFSSTGRLSTNFNIEETASLNNTSINISFTGANSADIALSLTENFSNERVLVRRGLFDSSGNTTDSNIIVSPFIIFDGRVDSFNIDDDPSKGDSIVTWNISSHWADWEKINGRKCNNQNAKEFFLNEEGFSHVYDQIGEKTFGRITS